jgi:hypothetical protein
METPSRLRLVAVLAAVLTLASAPAVPSEQPAPDEVMRRIDDLYRSEASVARIRMTVVTKRSTRELEMRAWSRGTEKTLVVIESPEREKGTATLKVDENLWNWFPRIARTVRVPPSMMLGSWMGSDFTNDDLVQEGRFQDDYVTTASGRSDDPEGWLYVSDAKPGTTGLWKRVEMVVSAELLPVESRFYDRKGRLARTIRYEEIREMDGRRVPARMVLLPEGDEGRRTTLEYLSIDFDAKVPDDTFSLSRLESGR